jgi:hypothetical protein
MNTEEIKEAIEAMAGKVKTTSDSNEALKFSQAALNLANVLSVKKHVESETPTETEDGRPFSRDLKFKDEEFDYTLSSPGKIHTKCLTDLMCAVHQYLKDPDSNSMVLLDVSSDIRYSNRV